MPVEQGYGKMKKKGYRNTLTYVGPVKPINPDPDKPPKPGVTVSVPRKPKKR